MLQENTFNEGRFKTTRQPGKMLRHEANLEHLNLSYDTPTWCRIIRDGICLDVFYVLRESRKIYVSGQDALVEGRSELPYFYRTRWAADFDGSFITFNDPTLYLGNRLRGGWWQLDGAIELARDFINEVQKFKRLDEDALRIFGASAGGFFSLAIGGLLPHAKVIADIPQVDLARSPFAHNVDILASAGIAELKTVFHWWSQSKPPKQVCVLFNERDGQHISTQTRIIFDNLASFFYDKAITLGSFTVKSYRNSEADQRGHAPMEKDKLIPFLLSL